MRYPLLVLDFEASSLGPKSYPIEVGVAVATSPVDSIKIWSTLIRPGRDWLRDGDWDPASERIHGIPIEHLQTAPSAQMAAESLNLILNAVGHAYCDGGYYDAFWFERLFKTASIEPEFELWELSRLFLPDPPLFYRCRDILAQSEAPHRAGPDAGRLCGALMRAADGVKNCRILEVAAHELAGSLA